MCNISYNWPDTLRKSLSMLQFLSLGNLLYRQMNLLYHTGNFYLVLLTIVIFCWLIYFSTTIEINTVNIIFLSENQFKVSIAESVKRLWVLFLNYVDVLTSLELLFVFSVSARLLPFLQTHFVSFTVLGCMCIIGLNGKQNIERQWAVALLLAYNLTLESVTIWPFL